MQGLFVFYATQHDGAVLLATSFMGCDALGRKEVRRRNSSEEAPVCPVGSEANGAAEHEALGRLFDGTIGEVRGGEDFTSCVRIRSDDNGSGAEAESHELGSSSRESHGSERAVSQRASESQQASKDGKTSNPRNGDAASVIPPILPGDPTNRETPSNERSTKESNHQRPKDIQVKQVTGSKKSGKCEYPPVGILINRTQLHYGDSRKK